MQPKQPKPKPKKISYKPEILSLVKRRATAAAKDVKEVQAVNQRRQVRKMVIRGATYDKIAKRLGLDVKSVMDEVRSITKDWLTDESVEAPALREIELQNLRALKELAMYEAFPHPLKDSNGRVIMVRNCDCLVDPDDPMIQRPCIFDDHNRPAMSNASKEWTQIAMSISARISAMGGLDAADKLKERVVDTMERQYLGVAPKVIDSL